MIFITSILYTMWLREEKNGNLVPHAHENIGGSKSKMSASV